MKFYLRIIMKLYLFIIYFPKVERQMVKLNHVDQIYPTV